jgi:hypothetical protein
MPCETGDTDILAHVHVRIQREHLEHHGDVALAGGAHRDVFPSIRISPEVGSSSPAIMRSVVVLPQPEGPSSMKNSPSPMVKDGPLYRGEISEFLPQVADDDLGHGPTPGSGW